MGRPDYYRNVSPAKIGERPGQSSWYATTETTAPANGNVQVDVYTVPEGYELYLGTIMASYAKSSIQKLAVTANSVDIFKIHGVQASFAFPADSGMTKWPAGLTIGGRWYNDTDEDIGVLGILVGVLVKV